MLPSRCSIQHQSLMVEINYLATLSGPHQVDSSFTGTHILLSVLVLDEGVTYLATLSGHHQADVLSVLNGKGHLPHYAFWELPSRFPFLSQFMVAWERFSGAMKLISPSLHCWWRSLTWWCLLGAVKQILFLPQSMKVCALPGTTM